MLRDVAAWLLYSPRRLLAAAIPVVALAVLVTLGLSANDPTPSGAQPTSPTPSRAPSDLLAHERHEEHTEPTAPAAVIRRAALRFLDAYIMPPTDATTSAMPSSLRNASTPALWRGLRLTQPDALPRGSVSRTVIEISGPFSGTVTAELDTGLVLTVAVVAWEKGWRVSDVRRAETP